MPQEHEEDLAGRLEKAIERIKGITSARVILNKDTEEIEEIHVMGLPSRRPKQIVRDTETLLFVQFGIHVDYRRISFVQLGPEDASALHLRLQFISAKPHPKAENQIQVILQSDNNRYEGVAPIQTDSVEVLAFTATATATLGAVQKAIGRIAHLKAQDTQLVSANGSQVCLVVIHVSTPRGEERLTGTCIVNGCPYEAAAKATLDAMNRRLPVWAVQHATEAAKDAKAKELHAWG
jgi:hypothetical protein